MAFEVKDWFKSYDKKGGDISLYNISRQDNDSSVIAYYGYQNDSGAYIIQRSRTSATVTNLIFDYYASNTSDNFSTDWGNRVSLTYVEYQALFHKSG